MRSCGVHHFGASVDRFHLPRARGRRGVLSAINMHEQIVVRVSRYLKANRGDPHVAAVIAQNRHLTATGKWTIQEEAESKPAK